jgi:hypothetical protein
MDKAELKSFGKPDNVRGLFKGGLERIMPAPLRLKEIADRKQTTRCYL